MKFQPLTLEGQHVRLEPLTIGHEGRLCEVAFDPELWRWTSSALMSPQDVRAYIQTALKGAEEGSIVAFATIDPASGRVIGSTRFAHIEAQHRKVEIGWTWIARPWQRTPINTEAKYLMLRHAFESWGCIRVQLWTNALNAKSRAAIERIGAKYEGCLRNHMIMPTGTIRDTVSYSIIESEWPEVKRELEQKLDARSNR
ncbi:MAG TPA: GNAT family protein [Tepidisphaeraceae bacterium]|jgi:RimJ/RimL family protein N-acetyltransferase|nr:GNAT family protein [Tepidisphaeraceae bacterium]